MRSQAGKTGRTLIRGGWIVAFDGAGHRILENGVLVYEGDRIVHLGRGYATPLERFKNRTDRPLQIPDISCAIDRFRR